jgi:D-serine deaminase-like pyridoxal phosphate-dependent protein
LTKPIDDLDTPAVTIRMDVMEDNIRRVQSHLAAHGLGNRPHIKTHKIPAIGKLQMAAGAIGITCQKLGEVEVFAEAGVADDVLLTYNVLGRAKLERLVALARRIPKLTVVLDSEPVARGIAEAAAAAGIATPASGAPGCRPRMRPSPWRAPPWPCAAWPSRG